MSKSNEAYNFVLNKIEELKKDGIEVDFRKDERNAWDDVRDSLRKRYRNKNNRINPKKWKQICFKTKNESESQKVFDLISDLGEIGIYFDTGAGWTGIIWELDWSFRVEKNIDKASLERNFMLNEMRKNLFD